MMKVRDGFESHWTVSLSCNFSSHQKKRVSPERVRHRKKKQCPNCLYPIYLLLVFGVARLTFTESMSMHHRNVFIICKWMVHVPNERMVMFQRRNSQGYPLISNEFYWILALLNIANIHCGLSRICINGRHHKAYQEHHWMSSPVHGTLIIQTYFRYNLVEYYFGCSLTEISSIPCKILDFEHAVVSCVSFKEHQWKRNWKYVQISEISCSIR